MYHQTCTAVDTLAQQYVSSEVDLINNSILHDGESFDWSEHKEFYEVSLQMFVLLPYYLT